MYNVFCDGQLIYSTAYPVDELRAIDPKLDRADNSAGSLSITLPPSNPGYSIVRRLTSRISVERDNMEIWAGRVISDEEDFWKLRKIVCEGELAYLNDSIQPPAEYNNQTVSGFLKTLLGIHNKRVNVDKRFVLGEVTVTDSNDSLYRYTNYETTLECILDKLVDRLGGHLRIRMINGTRYLDYLKDYPRRCSQAIEFGSNLLDFTKSFNIEDLATVIIPTGERLDESPIEALDAYLTVASVNKGSIYVESAEAMANYGRIEKRVQWRDVTTPEALLKKAQNYLSDYQWNNVTLEVTAVDLSNLNPQIEAIDLLDQVECISIPHGLDHWFPVSKVSTPLDRPEDELFTLGTNVNASLASVTRASMQSLSDQMNDSPTQTEILQNASENATKLITGATEGVITLKQGDDGPEEFIIANNKDYRKATKIWRWNINGFGYSKNGYNGPYGLAMTMDGRIVADYVALGTLADNKGKNYWNLDTGEFSLQAGTTIGGKTVASIAKNAVDNQTQQDIFNILTNDGKTQGIYLKNGLLYLNASYMQGGTLVLGGSGNTNGVLVVRNAYGNQVGRWDKDGINAVAGQIANFSIKSNRFAFNEVSTGNTGAEIGTDGIWYSLLYNEGTTGAVRLYGQGVEYWGSTSNAAIKKFFHLGHGLNPPQFNIWLDGQYVMKAAVKKGGSVDPMTLAVDLNFVATENATVWKNLTVYGTKNRLVATHDYSDRLLYCYEMPSPMFGDVGDGVLDDQGECVIEIDDIFSETTRTDLQYQVFLQKCGAGDIWVETRTRSYFVVKGTPGLSFSWELKGRQLGYETERLETMSPFERDDDGTYDDLYASEMEELVQQQEVLLNETA